MTQKPAAKKTPPATQNTAPVTEAPALEPGPQYDPAFLSAHGIGLRDIALVERIAGATQGVLTALRMGDEDAARAAYPALRTLTRDAEKFRLVARKASGSHRIPTEA